MPVLAGALLASAWQGLALTAAVAVALRLLPELSPAVRSALWTAVLAVTVALPFAVPLAGGSHAHPVAIWHAAGSVSSVIFTLWLTGVAFRLTLLGGSALHLRRTLRRARPIAPPGRCAALLGSQRRAVTLCASPDVDRPGVAGFFRPRILVPPRLLDTLSEAELHTVLLHECEHLRRRDDWVNLLQQLSLALLPLHPALHWLDRQLARERELACDDGVLRRLGARKALGSRKAYAACLARVAESSLVGRGLSLAMGILGARRSRNLGVRELTARVERILAAPERAMTRRQSRLAAGLLGVGVLGGAALLLHSPQPVSFDALPRLTLAQNGAALSPGMIPVTYPLAPAAERSLRRPALVPAVLPGRSPGRGGRVACTRTVAYTRTGPVLSKRTLGRRVVRTVFHDARVPRVAPAAMQPFLPQPFPPEIPVLVRFSAVDLDSSQAWYTAIRWHGGWLLVQI